MKSIKTLFIALVLAIGVSGVFAQTVTTGKASSTARLVVKSDTLNLSDLTFPSIEGWRMSPKAAIPMEESGVFVNYDSPDRARMTVYVYTRGSKGVPNDLSGIIKEEFDGAQDAIRTVVKAGIYSNLKEVKNDTATIGGSAGKVKALRALLSFEAGGSQMNSEIFVFPYKGHIVKLRVSRPSTYDTGGEGYSKLFAAIDGLFAN
jgi:hypothetical protein